MSTRHFFAMAMGQERLSETKRDRSALFPPRRRPIGSAARGPTVTVPIFDTGKKRFQAESKAAQSDEAADVYRAKVLSALEEAENALSDRKTDCSKRDALSRSVARYGDALRFPRNSMQRG